LLSLCVGRGTGCSKTLTDTKALGKGHVGVQFVVDTGTTVARAHAKPILVEVVRTRVALGGTHATRRVLDKVPGKTRHWKHTTNTNGIVHDCLRKRNRKLTQRCSLI